MKTRTGVAIWTLALLCAGIASAFVVTSDHSPNTAAGLGLSVPLGLLFVGGGLIAAARRPENRTGLLMVLTGFAWFFSALTASNSSLLFTLGWALGALPYGFFIYLMLAYPTGRLVRGRDRALVAAGFAFTAGLWPLLLLVADVESGPVSCEGCPDNAFHVAESDLASGAVQVTMAVSALAIAAAIVVVLARRWREATPVLRRALTPVYATGGVAVALGAVRVVYGFVTDAGELAIAVIQYAALLAVPLAFLLGLLRTRLARARAGGLLLEVPEGATLEQVQAALQHTLGDPTLRLAYWVPETQSYIDAEGKPFVLPADTATRTTTLVAYADRPVAALVHDAALRDQPELLAHVVAAVRMGLEKDRTLHQLRQSEARHRALLDAMPDAMFRFSREGTYLDVNVPPSATLYNREARRIGANIADVVPEDVARKALESFALALEEGPQELEYSLEVDGALRDFEGRVTPSGEDEVLMIVRDVTEHHRREAALRRSEARTSALLDAIPDLMFRIDREGTYLDFRAESDQHLITPPSEVIGRRVWDRLPPDVAEPVMAAARRALEEGGVQTVEYDLDFDGAVKHFEGRLVASGTDEVVMIVRDFTEQRRLRDELSKRVDELRRERDLIRTVVDTAPTLFCGVDTEGSVLRFNRALQRLSGHAQHDVEGRPFWEVFVAPDRAADVKRRFEALISEAAEGEQEDVWLTADGDEAIVAWTVNWYRADPGDERYLITGTNITKRKRAEAKLQRLADEQAALRRVATVVASDPDPDRIFQIVSREASNVLGAESSGIVRFDAEGEFGRVVGRWHGDGPRGFELGAVIPLAGSTALPQVFRTGRSARVEGYEGAEDEVGRTVHALGFTSVVAAPVEVGGRLWGAIVVATTRAEPLPDDTERRLGAFAELLAVAIASADAREELIASRARIVEAADAERRRLERNLHDGAQQRLVGLSLSLRLAQANLRKAPDDAEVLLARASEELSQALDDLRELARGIHPAVLTDRGLEPALEALAARSPVPVEVVAPRERLPQPVEAAAYYVVAEALTNVAKYAQASEVAVRIGRDDGQLVIEVADDGVGGADPRGGTGLRGLADRLSALDGRLDVASPSGEGTRIRAAIPLPTGGGAS